MKTEDNPHLLDEKTSAPEVQDEYSFMQEVIKDEAGSPKVMRRITGRAILYGAIFGIAASVVFCAFMPVISPLFEEEPKQVQIEAEEPVEEDEALEQEKEEKKEQEKEQKKEQEERKELSEEVTKQAEMNLLGTLRRLAAEKQKSMGYFYQGQDPEAVTPVGSGVLFADNGKQLLLLSERWETQKEQKLFVKLHDGKFYPASAKKADRKLGIAVYAVEKADIPQESMEQTALANLGSSTTLQEGEVLLAMGGVFGEDPAMLYGQYEPVEKKWEVADGSYALLSSDMQVESIGSGVLFNRSGDLVGVICADTVSEERAGRLGGYAVSDIKKNIGLLVNDNKVPYMGILGMDAADAGLEEAFSEGVYVKEVEVDSPAMKAGIQSGDILTSMDGEAIAAYSAYHTFVMNAELGKLIRIDGYRQGAGETYEEISFEVPVE